MDIFIGREENVGLLSGYTKARVYKGLTLWYKEPLKGICHYHDYVVDGKLYVVWGTVYEQPGRNPAELAADVYNTMGEENLFLLDGEFVFFLFGSDTEIMVIQCNYNMQDLYYRCYDGIYSITSDSELLFKDYCEKDIDESSVLDYLSYGKPVGGNTFSKNVKSLSRGQKLVINGSDTEASYAYLMNYVVGMEDYGIEQITNELYETYLDSVYKRSRGKVDESVIFLSGGLDSRLLLAAFNELYDKKITCISFGQPGSGEVNCARQVASVFDNPHIVKELQPHDFIDFAARYSEMTVGMDLFPQSYIFNIIKELQDFRYMYPGSNLTDIFFHAGVHRQYLKEDITTFEGNFSDYLATHLQNARMWAIDRELLGRICKKNVVFSDSNLMKDAKKYDGYKTAEIYTAYINNNDAAHSIAYRTNTVPGRFINCIDPSGDKKFCALLRRLPIEIRMTDELHTRLISKASPRYLTPLYPNINLPVQAPVKYWGESIQMEQQRERLFEKIMKEYNICHEDKIYYPYYYSDFNGYSRYDKDWISYIDAMLLDKDSYIYRWFDFDEISKMLKEHRDCSANYRSALVYIVSLEQFFRVYLR